MPFSLGDYARQFGKPSTRQPGQGTDLSRPQVFPEEDYTFPEGVESRDIPYTPEELGLDTETGPSVDQRLQEAREALQRASQLSREANPAGSLTSIPQRLYEAGAPRLTGSLRGHTEELSQSFGRPLTAVAPVTAGIPGAQLARPYLTGAASLLSAPDILRQMITPDEDESRLGGLQEAATTGGVLAAPEIVGGLFRAPGMARGALEKLRRSPQQFPLKLGAQFGEVPYSSTQAAGDAVGNTQKQLQILKVAQQIADETGQSLEDVLQQGRRAAGGRGAREALLRIAGRGGEQSQNAPPAVEAFLQRFPGVRGQ